MNLPFTRIVKGKHTHFPEKIIMGLDLPDFKKFTLMDQMSEVVDENDDDFMNGTCNPLFPHVPKLHTLRENPKGTWKPGKNIHFMFWTGRPYHSSPFVFAPVIPVVSVQKVEINAHTWDIHVDGIQLSYNEVESLAQNDGFDSIDNFFAWFNKDFTGSIIHWTNLKY